MEAGHREQHEDSRKSPVAPTENRLLGTPSAIDVNERVGMLFDGGQPKALVPLARFPSTWPFGNQGGQLDIVAIHPSMSAQATMHY